MTRARNFIVSGLLFCIPFMIAYAVVATLIDGIRVVVEPISIGILYEGAPEWIVVSSRVLVALLVLLLIGWLISGPLGPWLSRLTESLFGMIPVVRWIYPQYRQIKESLTELEVSKFNRSALVQWNAVGWLPCFVTGETQWLDHSGEITRHFSIYIPNTHLASGSVRLVPARNVRFLDVSVHEGATALLTLGLTLGDIATVSRIAPTPDTLSSTSRGVPVVDVDLTEKD